MQGMASPISVAERGRRTLVTELDYFPMLEGICFARQRLHAVSEFIVAALQVPAVCFPQRFPKPASRVDLEWAAKPFTNW